MGTTTRRLAVAAAATLAVTVACGNDDNDTETGAWFTAPADGSEVTSPVTLDMDADGIDIVPAGEPLEGEGHFHIMVDVGCVEPGDLIPIDAADEGYNHLGDADTSTELDLEPGEHNLCLQVGDGAHTALELTHEISITVTE